MKTCKKLTEDINKETLWFNKQNKQYQENVNPHLERLIDLTSSLKKEEQLEIYDSLEDCYAKFKLFNILKKRGIMD